MSSAGPNHEEPELPPEFEADLYRASGADLHDLSDEDLERQYRDNGPCEGRIASRVANRAAFVQLLARSSSLLEIGPFASPLLTGNNVKYFDVLPTNALRERAKLHGLNPELCPQIDFVSETGDLSVVSESFAAVVSSHVVEHQPDLISHLGDVAGVLEDRGRYYLAIPDKRYCFDHFIPESSISGVVSAHVRRLRVHDVASVIEHRALTTHNDPRRHWAGDHGQPAYQTHPRLIREVTEAWLLSRGQYVDVHAWQFVPASFRRLMQTLLDLRLSAFRVLRVYATAPGSVEFYAVLEKTSAPVVPLDGSLPPDFDESGYLLANPDVARAGAGAAEHYLRYGRFEGRRLR